MSESSYTPSLERLAQHFRSLPGVGKKSAYRMAFAVLDMPQEKALSFANAITEAKNSVKTCSVCQNISEDDICRVCADQNRDEKLICIVENPRDVGAIFRLNEYKGLFHVLHGVISPLDGKTPEMLKIKELVSRITSLCQKYSEDEIEVILATNASVEGEATAMYIAKLLSPFGIKISRLAYGMPVGADLEYTDEVTLYKAIEGRTKL
ncbi:MAG: recombination protein RecR [Clostridia bacterium]|nr:recombination protein RecR [Clostridia bacterium]